MINAISFLLFLFYTIVIFQTNNYSIIAFFFVINIIITFLLKHRIKNKPVTNFFWFFLAILFTTIINMFVVNFNYGLLIGLKLFLVCNITYIFSRNISYMEFTKIIEKILTPFKIFKINPQDFSLIICIAINFIPILSREFNQTLSALSAKGAKTKGIYFIKNIKLILTTLIVSVFKRVDELEMSLNSKGYVDE